jgi:hypothetical protein
MTDDEFMADNLLEIGVILVGSRDNFLSCLASVFAIELLALENYLDRRSN